MECLSLSMRTSQLEHLIQEPGGGAAIVSEVDADVAGGEQEIDSRGGAKPQGEDNGVEASEGCDRGRAEEGSGRGGRKRKS